MMIAPAAIMIYAAQEQLLDKAYRAKHRVRLEEQLEEVRTAVPEQAQEFYVGYMLGVQTARVLLSGMPDAVLHKVSI